MILSVLLIIVCVLLILVVLIQNSKGGGIQSQFSAANQIMGIRRGTDFIEKATWTLAILLLVFSLLMSPKNVAASSDSGSSGTESVTRKKSQSAVMPQQAPVQQAPAQQAPAEPGHEGHNHAPGEGH